LQFPFPCKLSRYTLSHLAGVVRLEKQDSPVDAHSARLPASQQPRLRRPNVLVHKPHSKNFSNRCLKTTGRSRLRVPPRQVSRLFAHCRVFPEQVTTNPKGSFSICCQMPRRAQFEQGLYKQRDYENSRLSCLIGRPMIVLANYKYLNFVIVASIRKPNSPRGFDLYQFIE
jgi:hypothetical protein